MSEQNDTEFEVTLPKTPSSSNGKNKRLSSSIQKFLEKRRSFTIDPPPEIMKSHDNILKEFHQSFTKDDSKDNNDNDDDNLVDEENIDDMNNKQKLSQQSVKLPKIKLFNLLYRIQESEIIEFGQRYDYTFHSIELLQDQLSKQPIGAAIVYLQPGSDIIECATTLNGEDCLGRPVRVVADGVPRNRDSFSSNRYFDKDISFKCNNCQEVGHRYAECPHPGLRQPCHLCASLEHDAGMCTRFYIYII